MQPKHATITWLILVDNPRFLTPDREVGNEIIEFIKTNKHVFTEEKK